jgi:hypothetical protein
LVPSRSSSRQQEKEIEMAKKEEFLKEHEYLNEKEVSRSDFPPDFIFGVATSAYQVGAPLCACLYFC